jgi:hypothetical protein
MNPDTALDIFNQEEESQQLLSNSIFPLDDLPPDTLHQHSESLEESAEDEEAPFSMKYKLNSSASTSALNTTPSSDLALDFLLKSHRSLDPFCVSLYKYYTDKGMLPILLSELMYLLYVFCWG